MSPDQSDTDQPPQPSGRTVSPSINGWNADYVDDLYNQWAADPDSVDPQWRQFFAGFDLGFRPTASASPKVALPPGSDAGSVSGGAPAKQSRVDELIYHYRDLGHFAADLDPLGTKRPWPEDLSLAAHRLSEADLNTNFDPGQLPLPNPSQLRDIVAMLEETYCRHIGVEYMHIQDRRKREWLQAKMEPIRNRPKFDGSGKLRVLRDLIEADGFENFLDVRYKGKKRFGLEGGETLIPMLTTITEAGPEYGIKEIIFGMAHRGRLNVLVNILQKTYDQIFTEFEEAWVEDFIEGGGDVKYHRGFSSELTTSSGEKIHLSLGANPSHLEFGHSVQLGRTRAKQRLRSDTERKTVVPILIHGDAAFPGQGIVAELFNMMDLDGYTVGGAIHFIINNQVGFTTDQRDSFSGQYCTDIAKFAEAPIFHVNLDDPEAAVFISQLALEWRQTFKQDIVIDLWCYRKYGHNEGDDPTYTQPLLYERVRAQVPVLQKYAKSLIDEGIITEAEFKALYDELRNEMDTAQTRTKTQPVDPIIDPFRLQWVGLTEKYAAAPVDTSVPRDSLETVAKALGGLPDGFTAHKNITKLLQARVESLTNDKLDWAMGELLAYGTLLTEGHAVRLTGQDVERGTFSHRHAVVFDQKTGEGHTALNAIAPGGGQAKFCVHNSPLTENGCLGFEYGYSLADPRMLILWEAQFGDFCNGAQVIFDQFIASAESKWQRHSGLVCLLPHGYEGAGPEHSSARLERFLQLCADNNMQVAYPTSPAQMFHLLRRQMKRNFRKPLIVMTPKSLLRHPKAVSTVRDLTHDRFHRVLDDGGVTNPNNVRRVLMCSGKIYYDLIAHREETKRDDVAVIRIEQLYPFPESSIAQALDRYTEIEHLAWVQEEPKNMGAYRFVQPLMRERLELDLPYVGREMRPTPAVASEKMHKQEQQKIMIEAMGLPDNDAKGRKPLRPRAKLKPAPASPIAEPAGRKLG